MTLSRYHVGSLAGVGVIIMLIGSGAGHTEPLDASALEQWRGFGHHPSEDEAIFLEEFAERELLVSECMADLGQPYSLRTAVIHDGPGGEERSLEVLDPNDATIQSLGADEYRQYSRALVGTDDLADESSNVVDTDGDGNIDYLESFGSGCDGDAHRSIPGVYAAKAILTEELIEMGRVARKDPRSIDAEAQWIECMGRHGFRGSTRVELLNSMEGAKDSQRSVLTDARTSCDPPYEAALLDVMAEMEIQFVRDHQDVLSEFGVVH
jgi:hypothetical protein